MEKKIKKRRLVNIPSELHEKLRKARKAKKQTKGEFLTAVWKAHGKSLTKGLQALGIAAKAHPMRRLELPLAEELSAEIADLSAKTGIDQQALLFALIRLQAGKK